MANVSDWSANELENLFLDDMNLSDERGRRAAKFMAAVKAKEDEQDAKLEAVAGGLVFRGTKATYAELEAVEDPAVGDMYSVTELGGENYAWDGTAWDGLGTSDANVVHKTGDEEIAGAKKFSDTASFSSIDNNDDTKILNVCGGTAYNNGARLGLAGKSWGTGTQPGSFSLSALVSSGSIKTLVGRVDGTLEWDGQAIQTASDERLKTPLVDVPDAVLDAWEDVRWGQFRFLDAVDRKGESARLHLGLIAQAVASVFDSHDLDACAYGILCHEARPAAEGEPAFDLWMVRYEEALAMEAACQRRRADRLEARVGALEAQINGVN